MKRFWRHLLTFLAIIGLRDEKAADYPTRLSELKLRYFRFRDLLFANHQLLGIISEMEVRLQGDGPVTVPWVRGRALTALTCTHRMIESLSAISSNRHPALETIFRRIQNRMSACLGPNQAERSDDLVVPLDGIDRTSAMLVGSKMATLGEIRNRLGLPVPEGFAVTVPASHLVLEAAGIFNESVHVAQGSSPAGGEAEAEAEARAVRQRILESSLPEDLTRAVLAACRALPSADVPLRLAVRSSAVEEDRDVSFAGQYLTLLNVDESGLVDAFRQVVASAYEPEAIFYRASMGIDESEVAMAVGAVAMIDAVASGVVFSTDPVGRHPDSVIVHAIWGLGLSIVGGAVDPDIYVVSRGDLSIRAETRRKSTRLRTGDRQGVVEEAVPAAEQDQSCLEPQDVQTLSRWVMQLERHFGSPQDMEWALDRNGQLFVLQSRPASTVAARNSENERPVQGAELLLDGGSTACPGAASGPIVQVTAADDLQAFPDGAVLVAPHSNPRFVRAMKKASAIVTDVGSAIGHMASLSREFRVPTIVGMRGATRVLPPGLVVTVDASRCRVYTGRIDALVALSADEPPKPQSPAYRMLQRVAEHVVPLVLTDPRDDAFTPLNCTSLHDLARYIHERSFREMFGISTLVGDFRAETPLLDIPLPIEMYVIDLGGGLKTGPDALKVRKRDILSVPFAALIDGMLDPAIPRSGPRSMDARGFAHVVLQHAFANLEEDYTLSDPCYAIVSSNYVNVASRVGFHFSAVDTYCSRFQDQNYITFRFKGGAADMIRRMRRIEAIGRILRSLGFTADVIGDLVTARYAKHDEQDTLGTIEMIGRLLQFMRQMDAAMTSDAVIDSVVDGFLAGRYGADAS